MPSAEPASDTFSPHQLHHIEAQTSLVERPLRTLKSGDAFAVMSSYGDISAAGGTPEGLFYRDTRYLSHFELLFEGHRPLLLGSVIQDDNAALLVDLANPDLHLDDAERTLLHNTIAIDRTKLLNGSTCHERIGLRNFDRVRRRFQIELRFGADFRDLFEVRGARREQRGSLTARIEDGSPVFSYLGLDGIHRRCVLRFDPPPTSLWPTRAIFEVELEPDKRASILVAISCLEEEEGSAAAPANAFIHAYRQARRALRAFQDEIVRLETSNVLFNEVVRRAAADLYALITPTELGPYPYAGIPWFSTMFGRDALITAMLVLWMEPRIARGVLLNLAEQQATSFSASADAQPGKILHERRCGEMANLGEVPFKQYYGSVDATPLFVMLAGQYFERTGDLETIRRIWPNIEAALRWCDSFGDRDGDGFIEYFRETENGLANQGWKDSHDSIFHADGSLAQGPIALVEVQAYLYAAKLSAGEMALALGHTDRAVTLRQQAAKLRAAFEATFWCEDIGCYALALDGDKRPCRVKTSNAGHALFAGIADPERATRVAGTLMSEAGFSGWGVRTVLKGEARYNPMSYHNGSVWPHDNAMLAIGLARYGMKAAAARLLESLFDTASYQDLRRLPELFCGFMRRPSRGPTAYPVACSPQAWAAAAPFAMLGACLGLELPARDSELRLVDPVLPVFIESLTLRGLALGTSRVDLALTRHDNDVTMNVVRCDPRGNTRIMLLKSL